MRAPRDRLRRRWHLTGTRAALLAHLQTTHSQYHRPEIGQTLAYTANRDGVAERLPDPAVPKRVEGDLALLDCDAEWLRDVAVTSVPTATQHEAQTLSRLPSVPGLGQMLR